MSEKPWGLWQRQLVRIALFEFRKIMAGRWWLAGVVAAGGPLFFMGIALLNGGADQAPRVAEVSTVFAGIFQTYILRLAIFFVAADTFSRLYRGEIMEKTLHYYLLSPVRREVVLLGKYLAGIGQMALTFVPATIAAHVMLFMVAGQRTLEAHFVGGQGVSHTISYAGVALLACVGYGAVFLTTGLIARNPIAIAVIFLGWESINVFLPAAFQKLSIIHYLQSICPVPLPFGPLAVITEPTSPWISVPGMLLMTAAVLTLATFLMRRAEVSYTTD
jgi:ABC-type transport system involved in multi-copper enzyme maturation permease subunit